MSESELRITAKSRLSNALFSASDALLFEGTNPWELDEALVASGFRSGPCEMQDLVGLDTVLNARKHLADNGFENLILDRMVSEGRIGKKVSVGWYRYPGGGGLVIDPLVEDLVCEEAYFAKSVRRAIEDDEIVERLVRSLKTEAQRMMDEAAFRIEDIRNALANDIGCPAKIF